MLIKIICWFWGVIKMVYWLSSELLKHFDIYHHLGGDICNSTWALPCDKLWRARVGQVVGYMVLRIRNEMVDMKNCTLKSSYVVSTRCCLGVLIETYYVFFFKLRTMSDILSNPSFEFGEFHVIIIVDCILCWILDHIYLCLDYVFFFWVCALLGTLLPLTN
jgi:hypothetical protein